MLPAFHVFKGHKMVALSESMIDFDTYISNVGKQPGCYDELAVGTKIS
jgi:hypothetical protein